MKHCDESQKVGRRSKQIRAHTSIVWYYDPYIRSLVQHAACPGRGQRAYTEKWPDWWEPTRSFQNEANVLPFVTCSVMYSCCKVLDKQLCSYTKNLTGGSPHVQQQPDAAGTRRNVYVHKAFVPSFVCVSNRMCWAVSKCERTGKTTTGGRFLHYFFNYYFRLDF